MTDQTPRISHEILAYLAANPSAQDTLEGIAEWWLLERCIRRQLDEVQKALGALVADGYVVQQKVADGQVRFRINRDQLPRIRKVLDES